MTERYKGVTERYKGVTERYKGVTARYKGVTERYKGVTARYKGVTARYKGVPARYKGVPARHRSPLQVSPHLVHLPLLGQQAVLQCPQSPLQLPHPRPLRRPPARGASVGL
eukprot:1196112-Prorocentrum_minimum.AAC.3